MIFAKKSLGQNFLRSEKALSQIVDATDIKAGDIIVEIGPGEGALTEKIIEHIGAVARQIALSGQVELGKQAKVRLIVIEKDDRLIAPLEEKFGRDFKGNEDLKGTFSIIHKDVLHVLTPEHFQDLKIATSSKYKIIGNIPYYITGILLRQIFELPHLPERVVFTVQKEVADRMVALDGKESLLSLSVKVYGTPRRVAVIPRGAFVPAPNVDSAVILIENIERKLTHTKEIYFFKLIHAAFAHKRKRLAKNLDGIGGKSAAEWEKLLVQAGFGTNVRAEDLKVTDYLKLL